MSDNASHTQLPPPGSANRAIMPPYLVLSHFLEKGVADGLLAFATACEDAYSPTGVGQVGDKKVDTAARVSSGTRDLGPYRALLTEKLKPLLPNLVAQLGTRPIAEPKFEYELVAHNDGAFYKRHIDTQIASERAYVRTVSAVYYIHAYPKAFTGGALRLHAIGDMQPAPFVDIPPDHNSLLVFPSWAPHEVMPVSCPSGRFPDSRFAVNCWVYGKKHP